MSPMRVTKKGQNIPFFWLNAFSKSHELITKHINSLQQTSLILPYLNNSVLFLRAKNEKTIDPDTYRTLNCSTALSNIINSLFTE